MSLASEIHAGASAKRLEEALNAGILTNNEDIINYLKKEIYPIYQDHLAETFGAYNGDKKIIDYFEE